MKKTKIIWLCIMLVFIALPISEATQIKTAQKSNILDECQTSETYTQCTIKSTGTTEKQINLGLIKLGNYAFVVMLKITYDNDGNTTIYSTQNGGELWHYKGAHTITLLLYRGKLEYVFNQFPGYSTTLDGKTFFASAEIL